MALEKSLFDLSKDALLIISKKGLLSECNQSFLKFTGYHKPDLRNKKFADFVHPDDILPAKMFLSFDHETEGFSEQMLRFRRNDGHFVALNFILQHKSEKEFLIQAIDLDYFRKKESEKFVNEHVLYLILDLVPYPVFVKNNKSEYILLNQAQASLFGMSVSEMIGKSDDELVKDPEELELVRKSDNQVLDMLQKVTLSEQYFTTPNGKTYVLQTTKVPFINAVTSEKNILGVSIDYTERKLAQDELIKTNFELDSFVYRASHDLKAPLRSVMGLVNLIKIDKTQENQEMCINRIEGSINKLNEFIRELTNYSRNARLDVQSQELDLEETVYQILENLKYLDPNRKVAVDVKIRTKNPFASDRHRIEVILQNILSNSIKYQNPKVSNPYIKILGEVNDSEATLEIKDNGIGIKKEYQDGVFKMFYRATELSEGSGLGLYIVKQSMEKLEGGISFKSSENKGTSFKLRFKNLKSDL